MAVRVVVLLGLALIIGVGTVIFAKQWIASVQVPPEIEIETREYTPEVFVLVATGNLQPGMLIGRESVKWQGWPTSDLPPSYVVQGQREDTEFFGAVTRYRIAAGEPITDFKVARRGEQGFLAAVLTPGMRAVTIPISDTRSAAGFVLPGDRVDVVLTHTAPGGTVGETVFHDLRVLAIDQALSSPDSQARVGKTATLEVTPREVEAFAVMMQMGTVSLSLRSLQPAEALVAQADAEKPEEIDKVPTVYPGETQDGSGAGVAQGTSPGSAVGARLGDLGVATDEHSLRRQNQTYTSQRDISVLIGGGAGSGRVVVVRGR